MVRGLSLLNLMGLMHGDVKSNNFILTNRKKPLTKRFIKLIDFGASKELVTTKSLTMTAQCGTLRYLPHEKGEFIKGDCQIEFKLKVDAWSLGIVLMEMLLAGHKVGADNQSALELFVEYSPQTDMNMQETFFKSFMKKSAKLLMECRGADSSVKPILFLMEKLLEINPTHRLDILSSLRYMKLVYAGKLNSEAALREFVAQELKLCVKRKGAHTRRIKEQENEIGYVLLEATLDKDIRVDKFE